MSEGGESQRKVIHVDMDCFYAAVEIRDNPTLKGKPVAVGGRSKRGVLTTASYEARKFGVRSAMPTSVALRKCPDLILVPINFEKYREASRQIHEVFQEYTHIIQPLSLDEAFLDVTDCKMCDGVATEIAREIRQKIFEKTKLTASAGIAPNKFLAKVASDWKKPNGQFTIAPSQIEKFIVDLPVEKIPGVGKVTSEKLHKMGYKTCGDLQKLSMDDLVNRFGKWGMNLFDYCRGIDQRVVSTSRERKSLSVEHTYFDDLKTLEECQKKLPGLLDELIARIDKKDLRPRIQGLVVKIKFFDFQQTTLEQSQNKDLSLQNFLPMLEQAYYREAKPVRLMGLGV
ncbi:MAG: DNA polymerase IV, partial [Bdellovibrionales bacterium]|nr:DNA polymerase IV [Bdellovibrionales bacterium]